MLTPAFSANRVVRHRHTFTDTRDPRSRNALLVALVEFWDDFVFKNGIECLGIRAIEMPSARRNRHPTNPSNNSWVRSNSGAPPYNSQIVALICGGFASLVRPTCTSHVRIHTLIPGSASAILSSSPSAVRTGRMGN